MNQTGVLLLLLLLLPVSVFATESGFSEDSLVLIVLPSSGWDVKTVQSVVDTFTTYEVPYEIASPGINQGTSVSGFEIQPLDSSFEHVSNDTPLVIIGGDDIESLNTSLVLLNETRKRISNGICVGALDNGILFLGNAGVLNGTRVASLQKEGANKRLTASGAVIEDTVGVIDDTVITASGPDAAGPFAEVIVREVIAREVTDSMGILYLGDNEKESSYVIPQRLQKPIITAVQNGTSVNDWEGEPFVGKIDADIQVPVGKGDWVLTLSPEHGVCLLYEQFTGLSIPYGTVMSVDNTRLGKKRDFTTNTIPVSEIFRDVTFKDVYQTSPEYLESNKTLREWTIEINNTNVSVKETVALLYDDIILSDPQWTDLNAHVCIEGKEVKDGILTVLQKRGDVGSSVAYDDEEIPGPGCYEILLNENTQKGNTVYLTVYSKDGTILGDKEILIP